MLRFARLRAERKSKDCSHHSPHFTKTHVTSAPKDPEQAVKRELHLFLTPAGGVVCYLLCSIPYDLGSDRRVRSLPLYLFKIHLARSGTKWQTEHIVSDPAVIT